MIVNQQVLTVNNFIEQYSLNMDIALVYNSQYKQNEDIQF